ncbi:CHASE domain-containing protein [Aerosakkonemataceae cyanobacterium BLCC-F154]|uniref:histidine kinase n=1 Tax=Floridaenema fluviatile BLCC-F154 TaxID=3153640 RepID=A0ABV4YDP5_9CYAN
MPQLTWLSRHLPIKLTLLVGIVLSLTAFVTVRGADEDYLESQLHEQTQSIANALEQGVETKLQPLESIAGFFKASQKIEREEFRKFTQSFLVRYPETLALGWVSRISNSQRTSYERIIAREGFANFQIQEQLLPGESSTVQLKAEYFPVTYIEPLSLNRNKVGLDLSTEPEMKTTLEKAINSGKVAITQRLNLKNDQWGLAAFVPVYQENLESSVNQRRESMQGLAVGMFAIADLIQFSLKGANTRHLDFFIYDESAPINRRFLAFYQSSTGQVFTEPSYEWSTNTTTSQFCEVEQNCTRLLTVGDRQWKLVIVPTPNYANFDNYWQAWLALGLGLLATSSLVSYMFIAAQRAEKVEQLMHDRTIQAEELQETLQELKQTQAQLVQTEKMSSLGQLVAGVAHEINNPVSFIYGNLVYLEEYTESLLSLIEIYQKLNLNTHREVQAKSEEIDLNFIKSDLPKMLTSMRSGTQRIEEIVLSLRNFSRLDESEMKPVDIHQGIDSTLLILDHSLKATDERPESIQVIKQYGDLPKIECYAGQLNQVFMNLLNNAIDAINDSSKFSGDYAPSRQIINEQKEKISTKLKVKSLPTIHIQTELLSSNRVLIRITDNGIGMTEEVQQKLFDPFFTTKPVGKGTGLGLYISYQIITKKHGGILNCCSQFAEGTEFSLELPIRRNSNLSSKENFSN